MTISKIFLYIANNPLYPSINALSIDLLERKKRKKNPEAKFTPTTFPIRKISCDKKMQTARGRH